MVMIRHPLSGTEYHLTDDGTVRVIKTSTGVFGTFDRTGAWLDGERRTADPALCMWVADGGLMSPVPPAPDDAPAALAGPAT